jgi:hypothetical protein
VVAAATAKARILVFGQGAGRCFDGNKLDDVLDYRSTAKGGLTVSRNADLAEWHAIWMTIEKAKQMANCDSG